MKPMKRLMSVLTGSLLVSSFLLVNPATTRAGVVFQDTVCYPYLVSNSVCMKEDQNFGGDNVLISQSGNASNLSQISVTTGDHGCKGGGFFENSNWNDCITSLHIVLTTGHSFCMYRDAGYQVFLYRWTGPKPDTLYTNLGDQISSFKFITSGDC